MKEYTKELMEFVLSLRYEDLPPEAVELAKGYDEPETVAFINGILGSFMREELGR